jgi:hypothetical protein
VDVTERENRIRLIDCFVNAVYVYDDDKIVITLNYKDGAEAVTTNDIYDAFGSTMTMCAPECNQRIRLHSIHLGCLGAELSAALKNQRSRIFTDFRLVVSPPVSKLLSDNIAG